MHMRRVWKLLDILHGSGAVVDPPGFDHDQSKVNADWIRDVENLEKDQIASESEEMVFKHIDLLNNNYYEN